MIKKRLVFLTIFSLSLGLVFGLVFSSPKNKVLAYDTSYDYIYEYRIDSYNHYKIGKKLFYVIVEQLNENEIDPNEDITISINSWYIVIPLNNNVFICFSEEDTTGDEPIGFNNTTKEWYVDDYGYASEWGYSFYLQYEDDNTTIENLNYNNILLPFFNSNNITYEYGKYNISQYGNYISFYEKYIDLSTSSNCYFGFDTDYLVEDDIQSDAWDGLMEEFYYSNNLLNHINNQFENDPNYLGLYNYEQIEETIEEALEESYVEGYDLGYDEGYDNGYPIGYNNGVSYESLRNGSNNFFQNLFNQMGTLLQIQIFPNFTIGFLLFMPLLLGVFLIVIKLIRG